MKIVISTYQVECLYHVIGQSNRGCFSDLWDDIKFIHGNDGNLDKIEKLTYGQTRSATYDRITGTLEISLGDFDFLNEMLELVNYDSLEDDDTHDSGLIFNITVK